MIPETFFKALRKRIHSVTKGFRQREIKGLPIGIDFNTLNNLCSQYLDGHLIATWYVHLSSWKARGAYRLILKTEKGKEWQLVYKDALYNLEQVPALKELAVSPGPPEYAVNRTRHKSLVKYLPKVYMCIEISPQKHYRYLFEDLSEEYQVPRTVDDILRVATELSEFHEVLSEWSTSLDSNCLLSYDMEFSRVLQNYAQTNLEKYFAKNTSDVLSAVGRHWQDIMGLFRGTEFLPPNFSRPIHGDFNLSNIYLHKSVPGRIKIVDWEWAGRGVPHADLASLLKNQSKELVQMALSIYAERNPEISYEEHKRFYDWCQLERGLLDASFLATQIMESSTRTSLNVPQHIERSLIRVLQTYQELKA
jgi:hypothetical protein